MSNIKLPLGGSAALPRVHIVLSDTGWIIEECARHLVERLPNVSSGTTPDPSATIQYYMTYSARRGRVSPVEVALFTHREEEPNAARLFNETALQADHAVAMSRATEALLKQLGVNRRSCIYPGVDLDRFRPQLKIAVVGRTYHTGRKGEALVRAVMDIPDIAWHFTGEGWPQPALHLSPDELPDFYRSMDYILVPAINEGGPMSVIEALASGVPVIASDVGWVPEFPHIPFQRGDSESLRAVLNRLRAERFAMRQHVTELTWENWAKAHEQLFKTLVPDTAVTPSLTTRKAKSRSVALVTHGAEDLTLGGPSVRVPRTRDQLLRLGVRAIASNRVNAEVASVDVVHGFNIWEPTEAYRMACKAERLGKPFVFSPILLDLGEAPFWQVDLLRTFRSSSDPSDAEARMNAAFAGYLRRAARPMDFGPGYTAALKAIHEKSSATIFLSNHERALFERIVGAPPANPFVVRNPVDAERFDAADPDLFRATYGLSDYVLCVGRIEHRKNQLMLATALASTGIPLVLIGHEPDAEYAKLVRRFGGPGLHIVGRIDPDAPLLASAIAGARVFALPSWAEGAPLAALEAGAAGVSMVLSNRSSEREYFGEHADYCDPASMASIRDTIVKAWEAPRREDAREALRHMVRTHHDWSTHAQATQAVYESVAIRKASENRSSNLICSGSSNSKGVVFDITTWAYNPNTLSGIVRVECAIARDLLDYPDLPVRFVFFKDSKFIEVPREFVESGVFGSFVRLIQMQGGESLPEFDPRGASDLITVGSSWMQNPSFVASISAFARKHALRLNVLMHDFTPFLFPHWYAEGFASIWNANCGELISKANRILVYSDSTARDLVRFCEVREIDAPPLAKIRLADEIGEFVGRQMSDAGAELQKWLSSRSFVLAVGALHTRKNYGLLYDVWVLLRERLGEAAPHLIIVGGVAWNGHETARAIREDSRVNTHIRILDDVDDALLDWLYDQSILTVYPSLYEGWGLPVGESLARGKICLASSICSMPEIAPSLTDLLPPMDRSAWAARIQHYACSASSRKAREAEIRAKFSVTTWAQTTDEIVRALDSEARVSGPEQYLAGGLARLGCNADCGFLEEGWHAPEDWGAWSGSQRATMAFELVGWPGDDMVLTFLGCVMKRHDETRVLKVSVNGFVCGSITFGPSKGTNEVGQSVGHVRVPAHALSEGSLVRVAFDTEKLTRPRDVAGATNDGRCLGVGLSAFILESARIADDATVLFSTRPEIRDMLNVPLDLDLSRALAGHSERPSVAPGVWTETPSSFVESGEASQGAATPALRVVTGTARLRLAEDAIVDLLVDVDCPSETGIDVDLFVNSTFIKSLSLSRGTALVSVTVACAILGASDPLSLTVFERHKDHGSRFALKSFRVRQQATTTELNLLSAADGPLIVDLADRVLPFTLPKGDTDLFLHIGRLPRQVDKVEIDGQLAEYVTDPAGYLLIKVNGRARYERQGKVIMSGQLLDKASPNCVSQCRFSLRRLAALDAANPGPVTRLIHFGAWHEDEGATGRWGAAESVSFWVRPNKARGLLIFGEHILGAEALAQCAVAVDGLTVDVEVDHENDKGPFVLKVPLRASMNEVRSITISGLPTARPSDLGLSVDGRMLSLKVHDIQPWFPCEEESQSAHEMAAFAPACQA